MGYTTNFIGAFMLDRPLTEVQKAYLLKFSRTRRVMRDAQKVSQLPDHLREAVNLPVGDDGEYYVGDNNRFPDDQDSTVIDYNLPPCSRLFSDRLKTYMELHTNNPIRREDCRNHPPGAPIRQPGLWCDWVPTEDGKQVKWNGSEKFYHYVNWLKYLIEHFLKRWCLVLNGQVSWQGENPDDHGIIKVDNNVVTVIENHP